MPARNSINAHHDDLWRPACLLVWQFGQDALAFAGPVLIKDLVNWLAAPLPPWPHAGAQGGTPAAAAAHDAGSAALGASVASFGAAGPGGGQVQGGGGGAWWDGLALALQVGGVAHGCAWRGSWQGRPDPLTPCLPGASRRWVPAGACTGSPWPWPWARSPSSGLCSAAASTGTWCAPSVHAPCPGAGGASHTYRWRGRQ